MVLWASYHDELAKLAMRSIPKEELLALAARAKKPKPKVSMSMLGKDGLDMSPGFDTSYEALNARRRAGLPLNLPGMKR